jgi:hypothetical protein
MLFAGNRSETSRSVIDIVWNDDGFDMNQSIAENPLPCVRRQEKGNLSDIYHRYQFQLYEHLKYQSRSKTEYEHVEDLVSDTRFSIQIPILFRKSSFSE